MGGKKKVLSQTKLQQAQFAIPLQTTHFMPSGPQTLTRLNITAMVQLQEAQQIQATHMEQQKP